MPFMKFYEKVSLVVGIKPIAFNFQDTSYLFIKLLKKFDVVLSPSNKFLLMSLLITFLASPLSNPMLFAPLHRGQKHI